MLVAYRLKNTTPTLMKISENVLEDIMRKVYGIAWTTFKNNLPSAMYNHIWTHLGRNSSLCENKANYFDTDFHVNWYSHKPCRYTKTEIHR